MFKLVLDCWVKVKGDREVPIRPPGTARGLCMVWERTLQRFSAARPQYRGQAMAKNRTDVRAMVSLGRCFKQGTIQSDLHLRQVILSAEKMGWREQDQRPQLLRF